ncbi:MAG: flagellar protein [Candidatus Hydrogenedentota bacterium]|nr:MAG: flagellar protein [Candidatus Hydrogenedentota bacterium]
MPELTKCARCGELFVRERFHICPKCRQEEAKIIDTLRRYVAENPMAELDELARITAVKKEKILQFVREGKLISIDSPALKIRCEECGTEITSGRFCRPCSRKLTEELSKTIQGIRPKKTGGG